MAAQSLTLAGKKFVILPKSEYDKLRGRAIIAKTARKTTSKSRRGERMTAQDRGDVAEAKRRLANPTGPAISLNDLKRELGI
jgi:hypothetical protein